MDQRTRFRTLNGALSVLLSLSLLAPTAKAGVLETFILPEDPRATILVQRLSMTEMTEDPWLRILADGTVIQNSGDASGSRLESKIDRSRLQDLLVGLIQSCDLTEIGAGEAMETLRKKRASIDVFVDGKMFRASNGSWVKAHRQLDRLRYEVNLGGPDVLNHYLQVANEELARTHPDLEPLVIDDVRMAWRHASGKSRVLFSRTEPCTTKFTSVEMFWPGAGEPEISATSGPIPQCGVR